MATAPAGMAQELRIDWSTPEHGASDVPLTTTVVFEYTRATGYSTTDWHTPIVEPRNKVRITQAHLCLGPEICGEGDVPRFVHYTVEHEPDTDYTWTIYSTRAFDDPAKEDTVWMAEPYVLRYSTASEMGAATVAGTVNVIQDGEQVAAETQELLRRLVTYAEESELGRSISVKDLPRSIAPISEPASTLASIDPQAQEEATPPEDHTLVLLLDTYSLLEQEWIVTAATIIEGHDGEFEVDLVRDGTYWPLAVRFADRERTEIASIGFYDQSGDRAPDPITVDGASVDGIDLTMFDFPISTARAHLGLAFEKAWNRAGDQRLVELRSDYGARPSGQAYYWRYRFHSPSLDDITTVTITPFEVALSTSSPDPALTQRPSLPHSFLDSDEVLAIVMEEGGQDFIDENAYRPRNLSTFIHGSFFDGSEADPHWYVRITGRTAQETKHFERWVDMQSGEVHVQPSALATAGKDAQSPIVAGHNYPNPFSSDTHIPLALDSEHPVTLEIYDVLGRRLETLLDGEVLSEGRHTVRWEAADLPSGVYFYRVTTDTYSSSRAMTLQR